MVRGKVGRGRGGGGGYALHENYISQICEHRHLGVQGTTSAICLAITLPFNSPFGRSCQ